MVAIVFPFRKMSTRSDQPQDLSELVQFVASSLGDRMDTPTILTDIECSARVWRGVERVHQELFKDLLLAQAQASALHDWVEIAHGGAR
jgi:hypothetical protein